MDFNGKSILKVEKALDRGRTILAYIPNMIHNDGSKFLAEYEKKVKKEPRAEFLQPNCLILFNFWIIQGKYL